MESDGGFANAERSRIAFVAEDFYSTPDFGLVCYLVSWDKRYYTLGHRDILGAFMGMGCEREIMGDIVLVPEGAQFVADKSFANYIESNLCQIGAAHVSLQQIGREELKEKEEKVKIISATVAALRLDAVAAAGYGISRSRMAEEIKSQNVKLNWKEAKRKPEREAELERSKERIPNCSRGRCNVVSRAGPGGTFRNSRYDKKRTLRDYAEAIYITVVMRFAWHCHDYQYRLDNVIW